MYRRGLGARDPGGVSKQTCRLADGPLPADRRRAWKPRPQLQETHLKCQNREDKREDSHTQQANNNFETAGPARVDEKATITAGEREGFSRRLIAHRGQVFNLKDQTRLLSLWGHRPVSPPCRSEAGPQWIRQVTLGT